MPHRTPVFFDPHGKRGRRVKSTLTVGIILATVVGVAFIFSLFVVPTLPQFQELLRPSKRVKTAAHLIPKGSKRDLVALIKADQAKPKPIAATNPQQIVAGFYTPWQKSSIDSLRANADKLTHVMPEWLHLSSSGLDIDATEFSGSSNAYLADNQEVIRIARNKGLVLQPIFNNGSNGHFDAARVHTMLASPDAEDQVASKLVDWLSANHCQGVNLDFEDLQDADYARMPAFEKVLRKKLAAQKMTLSVDLEVGNDSVPAKAIADNADFVILMAYDYHSENGDPGPIAPIDWTQKVVAQTLKQVPAGKLVLGIGNYALDWTKGEKTADSISIAEALADAEGYKADDQKREDVVQVDEDSLNAYFDYSDDDDKLHNVWMLDAVSAYNQWAVGRSSGVRGAALWALGGEDPGVWTFLAKGKLDHKVTPEELSTLSVQGEVESIGDGEILTVASNPTLGRRTIDIDKDTGLIDDESFHAFPSTYVVRKSGYRPKLLALTFDDGPDPEYTPRILDELKSLNVPATFFVIGQNAESHPDLVRRMFAEGHEIGSHSFTHPNMSAVTPRRAELELNATERAIQGITGHSTILFRPPYNADATPSTEQELKPVSLASSLGYLTVDESVDPQDWNTDPNDHSQSEHTRKASEIVRSTIAQVTQPNNDPDEPKAHNVILLHDAGGDREATIEALKVMVPALEAKGYKFVTVSQMAGLTKDQVMPKLTNAELMLIGLDKFVFNTLFRTDSVIGVLFVTAILLGFIRVGMILVMTFVHRKNSPMSRDPAFRPSVSVLIAAYNEEKVIVKTVESILESDYPITEVLVVDDGSSDATSAVVEGLFAKNERVRLITQENGGKASALNTALQFARSEIVVCVDADTELSKDAISLLIGHFANPKVGAVAGNVRVGNARNILTVWQSIEYTASQNLDRRAFALVNGIPVVPGAIGAWRTKAVLDVGGYMTDTLAEDMDLTWRLRRSGWKLETENGALAFTEAPDTLKAFFKQRFRWAYGTLQCLCKNYRGLFRDGWFGWFVMPMMWVFQVAFQILAPLVDLQMLLLVISFISQMRTGSSELSGLPGASSALIQATVLYVLFFLAEFVCALVAFRLEGRKIGMLRWLFLQRFVYRQIMYGVLLKSIWTAFQGARQGWGKLDRKANVLRDAA